MKLEFEQAKVTGIYILANNVISLQADFTLKDDDGNVVSKQNSEEKITLGRSKNDVSFEIDGMFNSCTL